MRHSEIRVGADYNIERYGQRAIVLREAERLAAAIVLNW